MRRGHGSPGPLAPSARLALLAVAALALLVAAAPAGAAEVPTLRLLRTLGDGEEVLLHEPTYLRFGPDGSAYLLNQGEHEVLRFDPEWNLVGRFGRLGQGPGEFENATGMIVHQDRVWVFELARAVLFTLAGEYVETRTARVQLEEPAVTPQGIVCALGGADRPACLVDDRLEVVRKLGQECPTDDFFARYQQCGFVRPLPHPDHLCLLLHRYDGRLDLIEADGSVSRTLDVGGRETRSEAKAEDGRVSMSFVMSVAGGHVDAAGRFWVLPLAETAAAGEAPAQQVAVYGRDLKRLASFGLPEGVRGHALEIGPRGELVLLDGASSLVHVLEAPALPAAD